MQYNELVVFKSFSASTLVGATQRKSWQVTMVWANNRCNFARIARTHLVGEQEIGDLSTPRDVANTHEFA